MKNMENPTHQAFVTSITTSGSSRTLMLSNLTPQREVLGATDMAQEVKGAIAIKTEVKGEATINKLKLRDTTNNNNIHNFNGA